MKAHQKEAKTGSPDENARKWQLAQVEKILRLFKDAHGSGAKTVEELGEWAKSPEGKAALAYNLDKGGKIIPDLPRREKP